MATDAVAMGLNLPAQQVIIGEGEKYDGTSMIPIPPSLLRQIAGRAGRYGHHEFGMAAGSDSAIHKLLGKALSGQDSPITFPDVMVAPTRHWVAQAVDTVPDLSTEELLRAWKHTVSGSAWFRSTDLDESRQKGHLLDQIEGARSLSMAERLQIIAAPVDAFNGNHLAYFRSLAQSVIAGNPMVAPHPAASSARTDELESAYKQLSLYCWFHYRYPAICPDIASAIASRRKCVDLLIAHVRNGIKRHCDRCGKILVSSSTYRICEGCYQRQRRGYGNEWDD